jgi:CDP-2,3-bis-(O-geranylgeranyl)-sn-glycerol synthase
MGEHMNDIFMLLLKGAYILIPAYFANMAPPLVKRFKFMESFATPIDRGKKLKDDAYMFGQNKTYRGFIVGMIGGALGGLLQSLLHDISVFRNLSVDGIPYNNIVFMICFGAVMGFGALFGDLVESFFKRRLGIGPGQRFVPWDQIDLVIGAYIFALPMIYLVISWQLFLCSIIMTFCLHVMTNHTAYYLNIRKEKW